MSKKTIPEAVRTPTGESVPVRILYLENDLSDFKFIQIHFKREQFDFILQRAETREEFLEHLSGFRPDCVLLDYHLPLFNGLEALKVLKEKKNDIPVIMISGLVGDEQAAECIKLGADDFLTKENLQRLGPAIEMAIEKKKKERNLKELQWIRSEVLETISDGIVALDPEWNYTYINRQAALMLNRKNPEDLIGKHIWTEYPEGVEQPFYHHYLEAMKTQQPVVMEDYYEPWDRWFENRMYPSPNGLTIYFTEITKRKRADEDLRRKSEELDRYFESSLDPLCIADTEGYFRRLNPEWERTLGYPVEELIGKQFLDFVHPVDLESTREAITSLAAQKEVLNFVNRYRCKDGSYRWIEWRSYPEGENIFAVARDITGRKQSEEEILRLNRELQTINRVILNTIKSLDLKIRLETILDEALAITGLEGGTICLVNPDDTFDLAVHRETSQETIDDLTTRKIKIGDYLCGNCAKDCKPLILYTREEVLAYSTREVQRGEDIRFHAAFPFVVQENSLGVLCVFTRTDTKPTESALKLLETIVAQTVVSIENARLHTDLFQKEERLRLALESNQIALWDWDLGIDVWYLSPTYFTMLGYDPSVELQNREAWGKWIYPDDREFVINRMGTIRDQRGEAFDIEFRFRHADGSYRWVNNIGRAIEYDSNGRTERMIGLQIDITDRKEAEKKLRESEQQYRSLFENMEEGFAYCKMIFQNGDPYDYIYLLVNDQFEKQTGLKDVIGKAVTEIIPGIKESSPELFMRLGRVALTGKPERFEIFLETLDMWFSISVYCPQRDYFVAVFDVITERKKAEKKLLDQLKELQRWQKVMIDREERNRELKKEVNDLLNLLGKEKKYHTDAF